MESPGTVQARCGLVAVGGWEPAQPAKPFKLTKAQAASPRLRRSPSNSGRTPLSAPPSFPLVHLFLAFHHPITQTTPQLFPSQPNITAKVRRRQSSSAPDPFSFHCSQDCIQLRQPDHLRLHLPSKSTRSPSLHLLRYIATLSSISTSRDLALPASRNLTSLPFIRPTRPSPALLRI